VGIEGSKIRLNIRDAHRGHVAAHHDGTTPVTELGSLFAVDAGPRLLVLRVQGLYFAEPREAHTAGVGSSAPRAAEPLRILEASVVGVLSRRQGCLEFTPDSLVSPALGAEAYPLTSEELGAIIHRGDGEGEIVLGTDIRGGGLVTASISSLLPRHAAVLGGTGQGKSSFTAAILQQLVKLFSPRIVVFDINSEYGDALEPHLQPAELKRTTLGGPGGTTIPYFALGRHGLARLLLPSERTQRPALTFALDSLRYVKWFPKERGAGLSTSATPVLFDDCRPGDASGAWTAIDALRRGSPTPVPEWPHMSALGCLVAESYSLKQGRPNYERDAFHYSNVAPLVTRIRRCIDDPLFTSVVSVQGGKPFGGGALDWKREGAALCDQFFGGAADTWKVHVVDLRNVTHDLMPLVLGSLLELFAFELFRKGQGKSHPTLLVLEEAHHYLRQVAPEADDGRGALAYERLAKEGRKFGLSLWLSTQRPSEVSTTVLAQCGTWVVFRLASEQDLKAVASAGEWADRHELNRIAGLPRQQAVVFGTSMALPTRVVAPNAEPPPRSSDPDFGKWLTKAGADVLD
jgi:hypothetical protein